MAAVATLPNFKYWHMKHQAAFHWLTQEHVTTLQPVLSLLGNIRSNFDPREFLKAGDSFPCDKHAKLMHFTNETIERL